MTYCEYIQRLTGDKLSLHKEYHDNHYGFPIEDDNELFERLVFEINQAGLNWLLILKKQQDFRRAFENFNLARVASYEENDFKRLMNDPGIIRNRLKINAAIQNARIILRLQTEFGSFKKWLELNSKDSPSLKEWTNLFKKTFKFTGGEIVNEFLISIGYLPGAHGIDCPVYKKILKIKNEKARKGNK